jgi:formamidopyrimidine-DNA glycosylase
MPELPEVETIARSLAPHLEGRRVRGVAVRERRLRERLAGDFERRLAGRAISGVARLGKALTLDVGDGEVVLVQLGMTGRLTLRDAVAPARPHDHVRFALDDGRVLVFNDVRRFGWLRVVSAATAGALLGGGTDPLTGGLTGGGLFAAMRGRRVCVKSLLMDQRVVLGIGNIYASEILFHAGIRPRRRVARLTRVECDRIVDAAHAVLADAIRCGGSTISDYRDGFDRFGTYQDRHRVYARRGLACRACGTPIAACRIVGRSSFYCRRCQR